MSRCSALLISMIVQAEHVFLMHLNRAECTTIDIVEAARLTAFCLLREVL